VARRVEIAAMVSQPSSADLGKGLRVL
jgi:hypothetical protein